jgi:hypothetical protein
MFLGQDAILKGRLEQPQQAMQDDAAQHSVAVAQLMTFDHTRRYSARSVAIASTHVARCAGM